MEERNTEGREYGDGKRNASKYDIYLTAIW
jgi:hypothetical protein